MLIRIGASALALAAFAGLAGCSGGGGDSGPRDVTQRDFDESFERVVDRGPTLDLPASGRADFAGGTRVAMSDAADRPAGEILADVDMSINFDPAVSDPISAEVSNIRSVTPAGTERIAGTLRSDPDVVQSELIRETEVVDGPDGPVALTSGGIAVATVGELEIDGRSARTAAVFGGVFAGEGASGVAGDTLVYVADDEGNELYSGEGAFYLDRE
ncbi:hypothetical protein EKE94_03590 [Mesobaculum littorinae]|uniref:Transferrin-binding protein B C-lobe/N-lobe beta barrel domain-containing protein n=1 Tax=Mesobaculum littorinae TaxID=2486419 RepID=A0A438AM87_9RHOB|nr:hypothetical protein [Mesobaculum littorinae]RVV99769.1 hypothetical protein EKE94_03590 [Mesobaculum littorinae]